MSLPESIPMHSWLTRSCARLILGTRLIDKAYRAIDRARSVIVLTLASDEVLDRFNYLAYGLDRTYAPDSTTFRSYLFPWEEKIVEEYFPPPPARLLIGAAGGGREALALARMGYQVLAFEPVPQLASALEK
jgi:hypothetical protein